MNQPRVTVSMPVYGRPVRTALAVASLLNQTVEDTELFIIGDCCPLFKPVMPSRIGVFSFNMPENGGGYGYKITNLAIENATGQYFMFAANDDLLHPTHIENYLSEIEGTDLDFVWFENVLIQHKRKKWRLRHGRIGHAALIIRTEFLKQMPPHDPYWHQDWRLIEAMIKAGAKYTKSKKAATYHCDPLKWRDKGIDL